MNFPTPLRREAGPGAHRGRAGLLASFVALIAAIGVLAVPGLARADSGSTLTVVGTSDVSDSGLMPNLIEPGFHSAYPQYSITYNGSATGKAIENAESGNGGPSVLIVHAASLENQFVANGFSYDNQYGHALFINDFILAGNTGDPAGVAATSPNDIARSFARVAAEGVAGKASFESRGGAADAPGTTVQEHKLWALMASSGLTPAGVHLCNVSTAAGGGKQPVSSAALNNAACPDGGTATGADLPAWYQVNAGNQAANVVATNACSNPTASPAGTSCYVFTDRGTYDYLQSQGVISKLKIVTRNNAATAPGGATALTNYFHGYIINPAKPGESVNLPAAQAFISYITSSSVQAQIGGYLSNTSDPGGPPFIPTATPKLSATALPSAIAAGQPVTVSGQVVNSQPGYAAVAGQTVSLEPLAGGLPLPAIASATTDANGSYSITFTPPSSGLYGVSTGAISLVENATLNPVYGDILSPAATTPAWLAVNGIASISRVTTAPRSVQLLGSLLPLVPNGHARVKLLARPRSSHGAFKVVGTQTPAAGIGSFAVNGKLKGGRWTVEATYSDNGSLNTATTGQRNITVPYRAVAVSYKRLRVSKGRLTLTGKLNQAPQSKGATVRLYALSVGKLSTSGKKKSSAVAAAAKKKKPTKKHKKLKLKQVAKVTIRTGHSTYTVKHRFARGHRYVLQLKYSKKGQLTTYSKYRTITVR